MPMIGLGLGLALHKGGGVSPVTILGAALLGWWTADRPALITQSGGLVSSWKDVVAGYDVTEATNKPTYSATAFAGQPGIAFDGVGTLLTLGSVPFPTGSDESQIFAVVQQDALAADASARVIVSYGGSAGANRRDLRRNVVSAVNRGSIFYGQPGGTATANNSGVDLSSRHVLRGVFGASSRIDVDGVAGTSGLAVANTGTTRVRFGATTGDTPASPWQGVARDILVTGPLTAEQETQLLAWLLSRRLV